MFHLSYNLFISFCIRPKNSVIFLVHFYLWDLENVVFVENFFCSSWVGRGFGRFCENLAIWYFFINLQSRSLLHFWKYSIAWVVRLVLWPIWLTVASKLCTWLHVDVTPFFSCRMVWCRTVNIFFEFDLHFSKVFDQLMYEPKITYHRKWFSLPNTLFRFNFKQWNLHVQRKYISEEVKWIWEGEDQFQIKMFFFQNSSIYRVSPKIRQS